MTTKKKLQTFKKNLKRRKSVKEATGKGALRRIRKEIHQHFGRGLQHPGEDFIMHTRHGVWITTKLGKDGKVVLT